MSGPAKIPVSAVMEALRGQGFATDEVILLAGAADRAARNFVSNGYDVGVHCQINHHTASSGLNPAGDVDYMTFSKGEGFVTANEYVDVSGRVWLLALGGGTYTNGTGGPIGTVPSGGANRRGWGREIANDGTGVRAYPNVQQDAVVASNVAMGLLLAELYGWEDDPFSRERCFSHFEWSPGRKFDPAGESRWQDGTGQPFHDTRLWNMDAFRAELRSVASPPIAAPIVLPEPEEPDMDIEEYMVRPPDSLTDIDPGWLYVLGAGVRYLTSPDYEAFTALEVPLHQLSESQYWKLRDCTGMPRPSGP